jgi:hypothetical protein
MVPTAMGSGSMAWAVTGAAVATSTTAASRKKRSSFIGRFLVNVYDTREPRV